MSDFSQPGYMNQQAAAGRESEASPTTRTQHGPTKRVTSLSGGSHRPIGNRSPPLARAPPALVRRTLLAACGPDQARRNLRSERAWRPFLRASSTAAPGRARPRRPVCHSCPATDRPRFPPAVGLPSRDSVLTRGGLRRRAPETLFLKPCQPRRALRRPTRTAGNGAEEPLR